MLKMVSYRFILGLESMLKYYHLMHDQHDSHSKTISQLVTIGFGVTNFSTNYMTQDF